MIQGSSQNLTVAPWSGYNTGANSVFPVRTWNYNSTQATRVQLNRGTDTAGGVCSVYQVMTVPLTTATYRLTADIQCLSGAANIVIALGNQVINLQVTSAMLRWSVLVTGTYGSAPSFAIGIYGTNSGGVLNSQTADLLIGRVQMELISGQSNTNPSEYQTVGMGGTAYANVDGVRYYGTKLAHTMSGNNVVETAGSVPLTTANGASSVVCDSIGPGGILMDQQQTVAYGIEWDFTVMNAAGVTYATKNLPGPTGDYYGCAIVETTANSQHYMSVGATLPFASTNAFCGFFAKPNVRNNIQLQFILGPDEGLGRYSLVGNGAVTLGQLNGGTGTFRGAGIVPHKDGWYYCWVAMTGVAANTAMSIYIVAENGAAYAGSGAPAWYLYGLTVMDTAADGFTPCQYATATRGTDTLSFPGANLNSYVGTAYAEVRLKWPYCYQQRCYLTSETYKLPLFMQGGYNADSIAIYDGTNLCVKTGLPSATNVTRKVASSWYNATGQQLCSGSGQVNAAVTPFAGTMNATTLSVGYSPWVGLALGGQIRNLKVWDTPCFPGDLALLTTP